MREKWIDDIKGFAIILVVIGHAIDGFELNGIYDHAKYAWNFFDLIYAFHMPLFFWISGYVFKRAYLDKEKHVTDKKRLSTHVLNFVWIYTIFSVVKILLKILSTGHVIKEASFWDILLIPIKPITPYWYLYVLIVLYLIVPFLLRFNIIILICTWGIISLFCYISFFEAIDGYGLFYVLKYGFFFLLGVYQNDDPKLNSVNRFVECCSFIVCSIVAFSRYSLPGILSSGFWRFVCALVMTYCLIVWFHDYCIKVDFFNVIGRFSLEIYTLHMFITRPIGFMLNALHISNYALGFIITVTLGVLIPLLISAIIKMLRINKKIRLYDLIYAPSVFLKI